MSFPRGFQPRATGKRTLEKGEKRRGERGGVGGRMAARVDAVPPLLPSGPISTRARPTNTEGKAKVAVTTSGEEKISKPQRSNSSLPRTRDSKANFRVTSFLCFSSFSPTLSLSFFLGRIDTLRL